MDIDGGLHVPAKEASEKFAPTRGACTSEASGHWVKLKWPAAGPSCCSASATDIDIATTPRALHPLPPGPYDHHDRTDCTMGGDVTVSAMRKR